MMKRKKSLSIVKRNTTILAYLKDLKSITPSGDIADAGLTFAIGKALWSIKSASIA